ncbi:ATP-binding protein [uncultured Muribaculum sp.]|uniref:AAA family ATPase n=1 Tax=uncultured Muribaculum sp. TaxID=1918613 RepID=UPI0025E3D176|nr:ATP-binding protein [uncultured Muribaculum sp.]
MQHPRNPFILGHRIERPYFCDRIHEQQALASAVTNGRNVVLISPRRMGKTSLVYVALNDSEEIRDNYLTLFLDILQTNSLGEFTYLLGKAVFDMLLPAGHARVRAFLSALKSLRGVFGFDAMSGTPVFNIQLGDIKHPEYTLDEIFGYIEQSGKPVVIAIDEFQQITKYPEKNTEAILRSHMQRMGNATFVFAGSERSILQEMFVSSKHPFYNSSEIMHLGPIGEGLYVEFAGALFRQRQKDVDEEAIRWAFRLFDGNTYYMQRTMNGAFADTPEGAICSGETVRRAVRAMLAANEVVYREMLSNISVGQKSTLYAVAKARVVANPLSGDFIRANALSSASSVQSAISRLVRDGFISIADGGYTLTDPLLRIFINGLYALPEI